MFNKKKKSLRLLRSQLRGAKILRSENRPFFVGNIISNLDNIQLKLSGRDLPKSLVGSHGEHAEVLLRQILLKNHSSICTGVMQSIGQGKPVKVPVPKLWARSLENEGANINHAACSWELYKYSMICLLKGIVKTGMLLLQYKLPSVVRGPHVVFLNLSQQNLPAGNLKKSYDVISWYKRSKLVDADAKIVWAQVNGYHDHQIMPDVYVNRNIFPKVKTVLEYSLFFLKSLWAFGNASIGMLVGKWWYGLLFDESVRLNYVSIVKSNNLAEQYFIPNSNWYHKPLWTYEVERKGSIVSLYYYSTNIEKIEYGGHDIPEPYGLKTMKWNNFIVWDKQQQDFLEKYCPKAKFKIVGPIDYLDCDQAISVDGSGLKIAVFDVTPTRPVIYTRMGCAIPPYYSPELYLNFIGDISLLKKEYDIDLLWKRKRAQSSGMMEKYFTIRVNNIFETVNIKAIEPCISARRLIEKCDAVISMPFTSTSIIAKELGKPSIFYDASSSIEKKESHGIPVLQTREELNKWLLTLKIK